MTCFLCTDMSSLLDPSAVVPRRSEAEGGSSRLHHPLRLLVAPCSVRRLPFPDLPTRGTQAGMSQGDVRSSWEQSIKLEENWNHYSITPDLSSLFISNSPLTVASPSPISCIIFLTLIFWPSGRDHWCPSFLPFLHFLWAGVDCSHSLCCGWHPSGSQGACKKGT